LNSLLGKVLNKRIVSVEVFHHKITIPLKQVGRQDVFLFSTRLKDAQIEQLERKGKYLVFSCKNEMPIYMISHLGMTGAFFVVQSIEEIVPKYQKHVHVIFELDDGSILVYSDQRRFGWVGALSQEEYLSYNPIQKIGPDPLLAEIADMFVANLRESTAMNHPIKRLIMKPEIIAGVGNIYACESLFRARIHPMTSPKEMSNERLRELYQHIRQTLREAVRFGGSSVSDYVDSHGRKGSFQDYHQVYKKIQCPECGSFLENVRIDKRSSFYCPECQR
jgi:formamidopyrimidine-DNA glycosylase